MLITRDITYPVLQAATGYPVITVLGPRQSGKTTLVRAAFPDRPYFSLESPDTRGIVESDPRAFLDKLPHGAILDEVQRMPGLLSYIQGIVDESGQMGQFILTGSHQPMLHQAVTQSLAGRTAIFTLWPFSLSELRNYSEAWSPYDLIAQGTFPALYDRRLEPRLFFDNYLRTYVERDVRQLIQLRELDQFQRFLVLLAGRVGQLVNHSSLSNDAGISATTVRHWLSVLKASFIIFELQPYFPNVRKRLIKSPKLYFTDPGLAAYLLNVHTADQASRDPLRGNLYENLILTEVFKGAFNRGFRPHAYFYRDSSGLEIDLLICEGGRVVPVEIKSAQTFTPVFLKGIERFRLLEPERVVDGAVLYAGDQEFTVRGTRIINPLHCDNLWDTLTAPAG